MRTDITISQTSAAAGEPTAVNLSDTGAFEAIAALHAAGIAVEAVVASAEEADALAASRFGHRIARVRVDLSHVPSAAARREAAAIRNTLHDRGVTAPRSESAAPELLAA